MRVVQNEQTRVIEFRVANAHALTALCITDSALETPAAFVASGCVHEGREGAPPVVQRPEERKERHFSGNATYRQ